MGRIDEATQEAKVDEKLGNHVGTYIFTYTILLTTISKEIRHFGKAKFISWVTTFGSNRHEKNTVELKILPLTSVPNTFSPLNLFE